VGGSRWAPAFSSSDEVLATGGPSRLLLLLHRSPHLLQRLAYMTCASSMAQPLRQQPDVEVLRMMEAGKWSGVEAA
jgi:hypothetical protein